MDKYMILQLMMNNRFKSPNKKPNDDKKSIKIEKNKHYEKPLEKITFTSLDEDTIMFLLSQC